MVSRSSEVCPHCGEVLWIELGFNSEEEYLLQGYINYVYYSNVEVEVEEIIGDEIDD